jgi:hypothetical protein
VARDPYLQLTFDAKRRVALAARSVDLHPGILAWGLWEVWEDVWRRKDARVPAQVLAGCLGTDPRVAAALVAFDFLVVEADGAHRLAPDDERRILANTTPIAHEPDPAVYFIQLGSAGPIKIGYASNVRRRVHNLQTAHVGSLRVLATIHRPALDALALESEMHRRFGHLRLRGEWFSDGDDLLAFIKGLS